MTWNTSLGKHWRIFLACFTNKRTCCVQITGSEALSSLIEWLNMNTLFWWDVQNQHPSSYDTLLEMMSHKIINKELIDHRNKARKGLPPLRGNVKSQVFATSTLNVVPILAHGDVDPNTKMWQVRFGQWASKGKVVKDEVPNLEIGQTYPKFALTITLTVMTTGEILPSTWCWSTSENDKKMITLFLMIHSYLGRSKGLDVRKWDHLIEKHLNVGAEKA